MTRFFTYFIISSYLFAVDVTFNVDMSNQVLDSDCDPTIAGSFNNWSSAYNLSDLGYGIWGITLELNPNSQYEYKFGICGWQLEDLDSGGDCTNTTDGYTNRFISVYDNDLQLNTYYYSNCNISDVQTHLEGWNLVWSDEFNTSEIDVTKWGYDVGTGSWGWGNGEAQYYTDNSNNSFIEDGKLVIKAIRQSFNGSEYTSARMVTKNKGDWTYARIEVRAKLPSGIGTWPAIWLLPTDYVYGGWPNSGEIDIMEHVGFDPGTIHGTSHTDVYNWFDGAPPLGGDIVISDYDSEFHDYTIEWTEYSIKWYVDDILYHTYTNNNQGWSYWPFDQDFHLLLNIAIGGTWGGQQGIDDSIFPVQMEVDYVRVYQYDGDPEPPVSYSANFSIDMNGTGYPNSDYSNIVINYSPAWNGWGVSLLDNDGDGIFTGSLDEISDGTSIEFVVSATGSADNWSGWGMTLGAPVGSDCDFQPQDSYGNYGFVISSSDIELNICAGTCEMECEQACSLEDLNGDAILNVLDLVVIVNLILSEDDSNECSDFNQDGFTNVLDLVSMSTSILEGN